MTAIMLYFLLDYSINLSRLKILLFFFVSSNREKRASRERFSGHGDTWPKTGDDSPGFPGRMTTLFIRLDIAVRIEMSKRWRNRVGRNSCRFQSLNSRLALYVISGPFDAMTSVVAADAGRRPTTGGKQKSFGACDGRAGRAVLRLLFINYKRYAWARGNAPTNAR